MENRWHFNETLIWFIPGLKSESRTYSHKSSSILSCHYPSMKLCAPTSLLGKYLIKILLLYPMLQLMQWKYHYTESFCPVKPRTLQQISKHISLECKIHFIFYAGSERLSLRIHFFWFCFWWWCWGRQVRSHLARHRGPKAVSGTELFVGNMQDKHFTSCVIFLVLSWDINTLNCLDHKQLIVCFIFKINSK